MKAGIAVAAALALVACSPREDAAPSPSSAVAQSTNSTGKSAQADEIAWFQGDVEAAFAQARTEGKPVFLYWGAEWCPPCHQLKATVFARPDFIEKMKLFVPVYLDGDTAGAQKWGDEFRVSGYPTLVVMRADRTELTRIVGGGMDLSDYDNVLDLVLQDERPTPAILDSLDSAQARLSRDDCKRLAYNTWEFEGVEEKTASLLERAAAACPDDARVERARLTVVATTASLKADAKALDKGKPPSARTAKLIAAVFDLLNDGQTAAGTYDVLSLLDDNFFVAAQRADAGRVPELRDRWVRVTEATSNNPNVPEADRIEAIGMKVQGLKLLSADKKVPPEVAAAARARVDASLAKEYPEHTRPGIVNSALWVLDTLGEDERLRAAVEHEIATAKAPYYYMLDMASLEEKAGHQDEAVAWLARAYRESKGVATRFQWGTMYVAGLIRMKPEDTQAIQDATVAVLGELDGPDRIYMRTASRLEKLDSTLRDWSKKRKHPETLAVIRKRMDDICAKIPESQSARTTCNAFLAKA